MALDGLIHAEGMSTSRLRGPHLARLELMGRFHKEDEPICSLLEKMKLGMACGRQISHVPGTPCA